MAPVFKCSLGYVLFPLDVDVDVVSYVWHFP